MALRHWTNLVLLPRLITYGPHGSTGFGPPLNAVAIKY
jgi:hypothetical protein